MSVTIEEIRSIIEDADTMVEMETLKNDVSLTEQGIDSLDMANVYLLIEEKCGVTIPDTDLGQLTSVDAIVNYLSSK